MSVIFMIVNFATGLQFEVLRITWGLIAAAHLSLLVNKYLPSD
jgi:hypothetical protein